MARSVLILYYSFTHQTSRVAEAMAEEFRAGGNQVELCRIQLVDPRYQLTFPLRPFWRTMTRMIWPQVTGKTGEIEFDESLLDGDYDLVCIGSPTWWLHPALPIVSFLKSDSAARLLNGRSFAVFTVCRALWWNNLRVVRKLASRAGGRIVDSAAFCFQGNQVRSMLSFISYLKNGEDRDRFWGCRIYPFGVPEEGLEKAKSFARGLAGDSPQSPAAGHSATSPTDQKGSHMAQQQFVGTYRLVSSQLVSEDGQTTLEPLGENGQGLLIFDQHGKLSAHLMNPDRPNFASNQMFVGTDSEVQQAYKGYIAFWGDYTVDAEQRVMSYDVQGSLYPNYIGHNEKRFYTFDGDRLTLKTTPMTLEGEKKFVGVLVWERLR